jgi:hypothetical protein
MTDAKALCLNMNVKHKMVCAGLAAVADRIAWRVIGDTGLIDLAGHICLWSEA